MVSRLLLLCLLFTVESFSYAKNTDNTNYKVSLYQAGKAIEAPDFNVWQRELITINVDVFTSEEFSYLKYDNHIFKDYLIEHNIKALPIVTDSIIFKKQIRIFIWPLHTGEQSIELSGINLMLSGRPIKDIILPKLHLNVLDLPDYLPPGFPVGKINIKSHYNSDSKLSFFLKPNELSTYTLQTNTIGLHPSFIPDYSSYLKNSNITRLAVSNVDITKNYDLQYSLSKTQSIPIVTKSSGIHAFDRFKILYIDPISKKINSPYFSSSLLLTLNTVLQGVLLALLIFILYFIRKYFIKFKNNVLHRRSNWKAIYQARNAEELSSAARNLQAKKMIFKPYLNSNCSVTHWAGSWNDQVLLVVVKQLIESQFSGSSEDNYESIKKALINRLQALDQAIYYKHKSA